MCTFEHAFCAKRTTSNAAQRRELREDHVGVVEVVGRAVLGGEPEQQVGRKRLHRRHCTGDRTDVTPWHLKKSRKGG